MNTVSSNNLQTAFVWCSLAAAGAQANPAAKRHAGSAPRYTTATIKRRSHRSFSLDHPASLAQLRPSSSSIAIAIAIAILHAACVPFIDNGRRLTPPSRRLGIRVRRLSSKSATVTTPSWRLGLRAVDFCSAQSATVSEIGELADNSDRCLHLRRPLRNASL